ncbi:hypothetical protein JHK84_050672 [Glycine max]|nr:hypothetical protein JHK84_050672 [Glycine max]
MVKDEGDGLVFNVEEARDQTRRFLTDRLIKVQFMKEKLTSVWRPNFGVTIKEVDSGLFPFYFFPCGGFQLPVGFMSKVVGQHLRNSIRDFVEYDTRNNMLFWKKYIRICVLVDLRRPLMKNKKVKIPGGEWSVIQFKMKLGFDGAFAVDTDGCGVGSVNGAIDLEERLDRALVTHDWRALSGL